MMMKPPAGFWADVRAGIRREPKMARSFILQVLIALWFAATGTALAIIPAFIAGMLACALLVEGAFGEDNH